MKIFQLKNYRYLLTGILFLLFVPMQGIAQDLVSQATPAHTMTHQYEKLLIDALENISNNQMEEALSSLEHLIKVEPNFKLAQLIYGDLLLARSRPITDFGNFPSLPYEYIDSLKEEAKVRWRHHLNPPSENKVPEVLVQLSDDQKYIITIDLEASRLYLFQNRKGIPYLVNDFYVSIGKKGIGKYQEGDQKTPTGVYFVKSFISPDELPDFYGDGAFPIDYPNVLDKRYNRNGYGIWLHGTPLGTYSRPPRDSNGCVVLSNDDLRTLRQYITVGKTPVILAKQLNWIDRHNWLKRQANYHSFIETWRRDWESQNIDRYLRHYARDYTGLGKDYDGWVEHKRRVNSNKRYIKVNLSGTSAFLYPGEDNLLVVTFIQDYESDNFSSRYIKRQYWRQDSNGEWKIIYEGSVS